MPNVLPFEVEKFTEAKISENPAFASRKIFVDTQEHLLEIFDHRSTRLRISYHARIQDSAGAGRHMENSGCKHLALVSLRRRHAELRRAH